MALSRHCRHGTFIHPDRKTEQAQFSNDCNKPISCLIFLMPFQMGLNFEWCMLCIPTSERVLRTTFAGRNRLSDAKKLFPSLTEQINKKLKESRSKSCKTCIILDPQHHTVTLSKNWFQPANGMRSTRSLVIIHNRCRQSHDQQFIWYLDSFCNFQNF